MAYVSKRPNESWEIRESVRTSEGPRSRTLATFRGALTPEVIERALERSSRPLTASELCQAAGRAGASIAPSDADQAARTLLRELTEGRAPRPSLRKLLAERLEQAGSDLQGSEHESLDWLFQSPREKADDLWDLLELADNLPPVDIEHRDRFPRLAPASE